MTSRAYYNELDSYTAEWLRNLIAAGEIAAGEVDERDIREVQADDIRGFEQVHFFAGIGGWSLALRLAGWSDDRHCWTGSPPCQPFSTAGKNAGTDDLRHLWPELYRLIRECRPEHVFGEQVPGAIRHGWLDGVSADLEAEGYAVGAVVLGAHSAGAPHIRQRLWWSAQRLADPSGGEAHSAAESGFSPEFGDGRGLGAQRLADANGGEAKSETQIGFYPEFGDGRGLGHADSPRPQGRCWAAGDFIECADGAARRVSAESCDVPMAHGVSEVMGPRRAAKAPSRAGMLKAYGNAIVPETGAMFVRAWMGLT